MNENSLNKDQEIKLKKYVEDLGAVYLSTPFSRQAANFLNEIKKFQLLKLDLVNVITIP